MVSPRVGQNAFTIVKLITVLVIAGVAASGFLIPYIGGAGLLTSKATAKFLDTTCNLKETTLDQSTSIYADDGKTLIATLFDQNRKIVPLSSVPMTAQEALIDTEDRRFYSHHGIDVRGLTRAALNESNGETQGASTLTQQLVKQIRFYEARDNSAAQEAAIEQTADRKIYEAKCALKLEKEYTKKQILQQYFNIAYFGEQSYGIAIAARNYFGKDQSQLTVPEAAVLVGLVKSPTAYDPFQNPGPARQRRDEVIDNMADVGDITQAQATAYKQTPIKLADRQNDTGAQGCAFARDDLISNVGFFCDYAIGWLESTEGGGLTDSYLRSGGLKIVTSISPKMQNVAQKNLFKKFPAKFPTSIIQPAVDPTTGEIKVMATSKHYNYAAAHAGNAAYTTLPLFKGAFTGSGSTYKYFALIAALTAGVRPSQNLTTAGAFPQRYFPHNCPGVSGSKPTDGIANAGNYAKTLNLADATVQSSNTFFVGLEDQIFDCDLSTVVGTAQSLGMAALDRRDPRSNSGKSVADAVIDESRYTFTLGQENTSALELAEAYGAAANDGVYCQAKPILSITGPDGSAVPYKAPTCTRKMSQWVARSAVKILTGDTLSGTARGPFSPFYAEAGTSDHLVAGKTGTNNASYPSNYKVKSKRGEDDGQNSSLWFVGLTPHLVATSALVNVDQPTTNVRIPGVAATSSTSEFFGSYASGYWVGSFGAALAKTSWQWPSPDSVTDGESVPTVLGESPATAVATLKKAGFRAVRYPIACGSRYLPGEVAYSGPPVAAPGSKIYYCVSNGKALTKPPPPPVRRAPPKKPPTGSPTTPPTTSPTTPPTAPPTTAPPRPAPPTPGPPTPRSSPQSTSPGD